MAVRIATRWLDAADISAAGSLAEPVRARAAAMYREADRHRFLAGRLAARALVAGLLGVPETAVTATAHCADCTHGNDGSHGRPLYFVDGQPAPLQFSFSRSGGWLAAAAAPAGVGVDLEDAGAEAFQGAGLEDVMATAAEKAAIAELAEPDRPRLRAQLWVRKEALLKAAGHGLRVDPRTVETAASAVPGKSLRASMRAYDVGPEQLGLPAGFVLSYAVGVLRHTVEVLAPAAGAQPA
ncbi:4'-phosphopantetheinyl transferase superfamily protein [Arthrobacter sp. zg-Y20]|uniref:4'-phosphopantetheinyl transferase superfamily protein n=1 Tax=unclassified Arthrobacter TaxID=235627 RepID=UPI001D13DEB7|nr:MULTISPECIES: 4'-phosphopantetheinyl transferase superfamily protein [unclassified Arthrobacter]MCC3276303.1 4'-phosphopantetheinyl transferase superfamily protein [Arthrobacter sp. zg-Y20]MDK1316462.1 4'-phosphopantetheinyl transferase superfamily protein [Arthrobacter sp. zg.Y20]WIB06507.1 4'-phosphopantetheinyl transferase superfamily protein [Arthrobacter sp. zg-Y20]